MKAPYRTHLGRLTLKYLPVVVLTGTTKYLEIFLRSLCNNFCFITF